MDRRQFFQDTSLVATGAFPTSALPVSLGLQRGIEAAARIYAAGDVMAAYSTYGSNVRV